MFLGIGGPVDGPSGLGGAAPGQAPSLKGANLSLPSFLGPLKAGLAVGGPFAFGSAFEPKSPLNTLGWYIANDWAIST